MLSTRISGGQAIYAGGGGRCSLGFNVRSGSTYYFVTAGHCTNISASWYSNSAQTSLLGTRTGTSFPGNDYGIVRHSNSANAAGNVSLYNGSFRDITGAGNASRRPVGAALRQHHRPAQRLGERDQRHGELRRGLGLRPDPHQRLRRAGRQRRLALRRRHRPGHDLRR